MGVSRTILLCTLFVLCRCTQDDDALQWKPVTLHVPSGAKAQRGAIPLPVENNATPDERIEPDELLPGDTPAIKASVQSSPDYEALRAISRQRALRGSQPQREASGSDNEDLSNYRNSERRSRLRRKQPCLSKCQLISLLLSLGVTTSHAYELPWVWDGPVSAAAADGERWGAYIGDLMVGVVDDYPVLRHLYEPYIAQTTFLTQAVRTAGELLSGLMEPEP